MKYSSGLWMLALATASWWQPTGAIIIRHDWADSVYRALAADFPATAVLSTDGTGVLVGSTWVLTAAHVAMGTTRRSTSVRIRGADYGVARIYIHPEWTSMGVHDIALLRLADPVPDVPPVGLYDSDDESGQVVTFVGAGDYGTGMTGPDDMAGILRAATNRVDSVDAHCVYFTFDSAASATELEGISGPGDSGGPAFVRRDHELFTVGVSSMGLGRGDGPGRYGSREIYTRVSTHREWLVTTMAGENTESAIIPPSSTAAEDGENVSRADLPEGLSDSEAGLTVAGFLGAYNSGDSETYMTFLKQHTTAAYFQSRPDTAHTSRYLRLRGQYFGDLSVSGVNKATDTEISVRCTGSLGKQAELKFRFRSTEPVRISELEIFVVEFNYD